MKRISFSLLNVFFSVVLILSSFMVVSCIDFDSLIANTEPPQNLKVEQVFTNAIAISWRGNSTYYGYVVYVSKTPDISKAEIIDVGDNTSVAISGFDPLTTYYFWVAGSFFSRIGNPSEMISATTLVDGPTEAKLKIVDNNLVVSFNKAQAATGYNIYYNTNSNLDSDKKVSVNVSKLTYNDGFYSYEMKNFASKDGMYFVWITGTAPNSESSNLASAFARKGIPEYQFYIEEGQESGYVELETNGNRATLVKINLDKENISDSQSGKVDPSVKEKSIFDYPVYYINGTKLPRGLLVDENDIVDSSKVIRLEHEPSKNFAFNMSDLTMKKSSRGVSDSEYTDFSSYNLGDTRSFWIDSVNSLGQTTFKQINATLQVEGEYGYIWVADSNYSDYSFQDSDSDNKLKLWQLEDISDTFDKMYQAETSIFGKTYKEQYDEMWDYGLVVPKEKISILLFDISDDYDANQSGGILGYFWAKDMLPNEYTDTEEVGYLKSNEEEIFYMDVHFLDKFRSLALGTLVHEFQHMLHFVNKTVKYASEDSGSETWYNEMFSMLVEDLFAKELDINLHEIIDVYIKSFMTGYASKSLTTWNDDNLSYGYSYLLGAFVARNYGDGIEVVKEMASNEYFNIESIVEAIKTVTGDDDFTEEDLFRDFTRALCYPEGMLGSNEINALIPDVRHFDKEINTSIEELDPDSDIDFDIYLEPIIFSDYSLVAQDSSGQIFTIIGPYQYTRNNQYNQNNVICGKGFALQDLGVFDDSTEFYYNKPSNTNIKEYFIVQ